MIPILVLVLAPCGDPQFKVENKTAVDSRFKVVNKTAPLASPLASTSVFGVCEGPNCEVGSITRNSTRERRVEAFSSRPILFPRLFPRLRGR